MQQEEAETLALEILGFIAADDYLMRGLLAQSGLTQQDFMQSVSNPAFLAMILDYFMSNDKAAGNFLEEKNYSPNIIQNARRALPAPSEQPPRQLGA